MQGSYRMNGKITLEWDVNEEKLYDPSGEFHLLPCDLCGKPQWVNPQVVAVVCECCAKED